jgi:hypothetical protein
LLVELSFTWLFWILISIDNVPLLVELSMLVPDDDISVLIIMSSININNLTLLIDNMW